MCGGNFAPYPLVEGVTLNLHGRKHCLDCKPLRHLSKPRKPVVRSRTTKTCEACGRPFPVKAVIDGKMRSLYRRRFCLECSPFGTHNTSKLPIGMISREELAEARRRKRNAKTYRWQKKRRQRRKKELVDAAGGRCAACGYAGSVAALEFHHRDPSTKVFEMGAFSGGSLSRLQEEVGKCDLLCANCHRQRHAAMENANTADPVVIHRRKRKLKAITYMGSTCHGCGRDGAPSLFEFHHWNAAEKEFGVSDGIPRRWERTVAELAKCVMLCANCHREVHAGVRTLDEGLLGLAEAPLAYVA